MPVGVGRLLVYVPVVGSTTQLERNCWSHEYVYRGCEMGRERRVRCHGSSRLIVTPENKQRDEFAKLFLIVHTCASPTLSLCRIEKGKCGQSGRDTSCRHTGDE